MVTYYYFFWTSEYSYFQQILSSVLRRKYYMLLRERLSLFLKAEVFPANALKIESHHLFCAV